MRHCSTILTLTALEKTRLFRWIGNATIALVVLVAMPSRSDVMDWEALAETGTVEVITEDEDGSSRETTIWLLVQDGEGYVRTGGSTWGTNVSRAGRLVLRVGEIEYPLRVEFVEDDEKRALIKEGFREKYGWPDAMMSWFRGDRPQHMRLLSP